MYLNKQKNKLLAVLILTAILSFILAFSFGTKNGRAFEETAFLKISAGGGHSLAIDADGNLWAWGGNWNGQIGNNSTVNCPVPVQIMQGSRFLEIATGWDYSLAIDSEGSLWTWGANYYGQLGNGTTTDSLIPIKIKEGTTFIEISAGGSHSLALDSESNLWTWGYNYYGQLGNNTTTISLIPIKIKEGTTFVAISAGSGHSLAIDSDGSLWAWGYNGDGELGDGISPHKYNPVTVKFYQGAEVLGVPTLLTNNQNSITVNAVTLQNNFGSQTMEYSISTNPAIPGVWQNSTIFTNLKMNTTYYVFARAQENLMYAAGVWTVSAGFITDGKYAGAEVSDKPEVLSKTQNSIKVKEVTTTGNQQVEYSIGKNAAIPGTIWQDSTEFIGLDADTTYYVFARAKENDTHETGEWKVSAVIKTDSTGEGVFPYWIIIIITAGALGVLISVILKKRKGRGNGRKNKKSNADDVEGYGVLYRRTDDDVYFEKTFVVKNTEKG
ncbi:MAG: hypothetical protein FWG51_00385 [Firmicutes bacterium]|nr:hypothetical protein [Bacillota bacterium]